MSIKYEEQVDYTGELLDEARQHQRVIDQYPDPPDEYTASDRLLNLEEYSGVLHRIQKDQHGRQNVLDMYQEQLAGREEKVSFQLSRWKAKEDERRKAMEKWVGEQIAQQLKVVPALQAENAALKGVIAEKERENARLGEEKAALQTLANDFKTNLETVESHWNNAQGTLNQFKTFMGALQGVTAGEMDARLKIVEKSVQIEGVELSTGKTRITALENDVVKKADYARDKLAMEKKMGKEGIEGRLTKVEDKVGSAEKKETVLARIGAAESTLTTVTSTLAPTGLPSRITVLEETLNGKDHGKDGLVHFVNTIRADLDGEKDKAGLITKVDNNTTAISSLRADLDGTKDKDGLVKEVATIRSIVVGKDKDPGLVKQVSSIRSVLHGKDNDGLVEKVAAIRSELDGKDDTVGLIKRVGNTSTSLTNVLTVLNGDKDTDGLVKDVGAIRSALDGDDGLITKVNNAASGVSTIRTDLDGSKEKEGLIKQITDTSTALTNVRSVLDGNKDINGLVKDVGAIRAQLDGDDGLVNKVNNATSGVSTLRTDLDGAKGKPGLVKALASIRSELDGKDDTVGLIKRSTDNTTSIGNIRSLLDGDEKTDGLVKRVASIRSELDGEGDNVGLIKRSADNTTAVTNIRSVLDGTKESPGLVKGVTTIRGQLDGKEGLIQRVNGAVAGITSLKETLNGKEKTPGLVKRLGSAESSITTLQATLNGSKNVTGLSSRVATAEGSITNLETMINGEQGTPGLATRITTAETNASAALDDIRGNGELPGLSDTVSDIDNALHDTNRGGAVVPGIFSRVTLLDTSVFGNDELSGLQDRVVDLESFVGTSEQGRIFDIENWLQTRYDPSLADLMYRFDHGDLGDVMSWEISNRGNELQGLISSLSAVTDHQLQLIGGIDADAVDQMVNADFLALIGHANFGTLVSRLRDISKVLDKSFGLLLSEAGNLVNALASPHRADLVTVAGQIGGISDALEHNELARLVGLARQFEGILAHPQNDLLSIPQPTLDTMSRILSSVYVNALRVDTELVEELLQHPNIGAVHQIISHLGHLRAVLFHPQVTPVTSNLAPLVQVQGSNMFEVLNSPSLSYDLDRILSILGDAQLGSVLAWDTSIGNNILGACSLLNSQRNADLVRAGTVLEQWRALNMSPGQLGEIANLLETANQHVGTVNSRLSHVNAALANPLLSLLDKDYTTLLAALADTTNRSLLSIPADTLNSLAQATKHDFPQTFADVNALLARFTTEVPPKVTRVEQAMVNASALPSDQDVQNVKDVLDLLEKNKDEVAKASGISVEALEALLAGDTATTLVGLKSSLELLSPHLDTLSALGSVTSEQLASALTLLVDPAFVAAIRAPRPSSQPALQPAPQPTAKGKAPEKPRAEPTPTPSSSGSASQSKAPAAPRASTGGKKGRQSVGPDGEKEERKVRGKIPSKWFDEACPGMEHEVKGIFPTWALASANSDEKRTGHATYVAAGGTLDNTWYCRSMLNHLVDMWIAAGMKNDETLGVVQRAAEKCRTKVVSRGDPFGHRLGEIDVVFQPI